MPSAGPSDLLQAAAKSARCRLRSSFGAPANDCGWKSSDLLEGEPMDHRMLNLVPRMLNKAPEVTLVFWTIKVMSTTVGETGADYLAVHVGLGTTVTGLPCGRTKRHTG